MGEGVCKSYSKIEPNYHLPCNITVNNTFKLFLSSLVTIIYALKLQFSLRNKEETELSETDNGKRSDTKGLNTLYFYLIIIP